MLFPSRNLLAVTGKISALVRAVVFLSLITSTAIYGKNASSYVSIREQNARDFPAKNITMEKNYSETSESITNAIRPSFRVNNSAVEASESRTTASTTREAKTGPETAARTTASGEAYDVKPMTRRQTEERTQEQDPNGPCRSFVTDVLAASREEFEFYSPGYSPNQPYPSRTDCVKTIVAPPGHLLRLDFRNDFHLEQSEDCRFDRLEIRDGAHGYSNLIGSYCGNKHPPPVTSSDRYLWLRFESDENIQYSGFHAVYWYVPRPTNSDQHPETDMCRIELTGNEGFANRSDIDESRIRFSTTYGLPLDCMWIISVEQGWKIMLQFLKFRLEKPNDCESNFVDVFSDRTDLPSRLKNFCGSIADSVISKSNVLHLRFFAEARSINSTFEALFTAFRDKPRDEACEENEYDCEDATCISLDLRCNGRINCRFRWDEDECQPKLGAFAVILESEHIIIILVVFCLILSGMCFAFLFNCTKKLIRDHRIIQEHLRQSKENELNVIGRKEWSTARDATKSKITTVSNHAGTRSNSSAGGSPLRDGKKLSPDKKRSFGNEQCYVPSGDIIPIFDGRRSRERRDGEAGTDPDADDAELSEMPEMKDSECQTRESLFSTQLIDFTNSDRSPTPPPSSASSDKKIRGGGSRAPPFSTFGYAKSDEAGQRRSGTAANEARIPVSGFGRPREIARRHPPEEDGRADEKRYKAEATIEMEAGRKEDPISPNDVARPFSMDSTKSAPDVIVTH